MKKVFLTISRGSIARNVLQNDFYRLLRNQYQVRLVTTAATDERFRKEFGHPNVSYIAFQEQDHTWADRWLFFLHKNLVYNSTVAQKNRWGSPGNPKSKQPSWLSYIIKRIIFFPLSHIHWLRDIVRFLDQLLLQKREITTFKKLLQQEKPDLVIVTNITSDTEVALLKAAEQLGIHTIAMPKSWDNLSKHGFRIKVDRLIVWSQFMKEQAERFQNYSTTKIEVIGIPQFDCYADRRRLVSREEFCRWYGLDPNKKIIFFGSEGKLFPTDAEIAAILYEYTSSHGDQLLLRPHYGYRNDEKKFSALVGKPGVTVDLFNNPSAYFRDEWDYSEAFNSRFMNTLHHSDIIINTCSTLSLDAVAFDKPIISIGFDGYTKKPYHSSILRWYETDYYRAVLATGAVDVARSKAELFSLIDASKANPTRRASERKILRERFCGPIDGKAGERFFKIIQQYLK